VTPAARGADGGPRPDGYPGPGGRAQVYLHAGELHAATAPTAITTILGSCVAVCLFDPRAGVGGMNHFLLPHAVERIGSPRFGSVAVPALVASVVRAGARRAALLARLVGGASVVPALRAAGGLGAENARLAAELLAGEGIPVLDLDLGGTRGRRVVFHSDDGAAWVRRI
jgi:chemotaxis protein CheD